MTLPSSPRSVPASMRQLLRTVEPLTTLEASGPHQAGQRPRPAAVLIPVADPGAGPQALFVEKSATVRHHAGQIAFPGGRIEPGESPLAAAVREAGEEVGLVGGELALLGSLARGPVRGDGFDVAAVVALWRTPRDVAAQDDQEIAAVHRIAIADLANPVSRFTSVHPHGHRGPAFAVGELFIWGFTGMLVDELLRVAGWEEPWDPQRTTTIPARFRFGKK